MELMDLMVVDDEEGVRRSLKKVLERAGYRIILAGSGQEAIGIVRADSGSIETVISDFKMPGIDGLETLIEIGRINPEITRIMLTGYATMESAIEAVNVGIDGFLTKPFENTELRAKVREYNLKKRLKQFVSEQIFLELQREGQKIVPRNVPVTVLFIDIRGFSGMAEKIHPEELSELLNVHYFTPLDNIIFEHNGTLDKHIGDSIMAVFGAPLSDGNDTVRAVASALRMREAMAEINGKLAGRGRKIPVGMGISTGEALAGIFGSVRKKEYTVFGSAVNVASRLERLAKENQILICEQTYRRVQEMVLVEPMEIPAIRGMEKKIDVFNIVGRREKI
ncbi:MAG: response regulator [Deltaproteobacteria bacterium]|nr:response regulator [Deltaproteobacteria bacterium]